MLKANVSRLETESGIHPSGSHGNTVCIPPPHVVELAAQWKKARERSFSRSVEEFRAFHGECANLFSDEAILRGNVALPGSFRAIDPLVLAEIAHRLSRTEKQLRILEIGAGRSFGSMCDDVGAPYFSRYTKVAFGDRVAITVSDIGMDKVETAVEAHFGLQCASVVDYTQLGKAFSGCHFDLIFGRHLHPTAPLPQIARSALEILSHDGSVIVHRDIPTLSPEEYNRGEVVFVAVSPETFRLCNEVSQVIDQVVPPVRYLHQNRGRK